LHFRFTIQINSLIRHNFFIFQASDLRFRTHVPLTTQQKLYKIFNKAILFLVDGFSAMGL
jgi:hypothetical protein